MKDQDVSIKLLNLAANNTYVNLHFPGNDDEKKQKMAGEVVEKILEKKHKKKYFIHVDIAKFSDDKKESARILARTLNDQLLEYQFSHRLHAAGSVDLVLKQLNERLDKPALLIFSFFKEPKGKREKHLLKSIRKYMEMEVAIYLEMLLISSSEVRNWEMDRESIVDERHVLFLSYPE